jgi:N-acetylneuraminate epimerase
MFLHNFVEAQKKQAMPMQWQVAAALPADNGAKHSLGFAGLVTGITNDVFLVAGGANFPDGMPWLGGQKKYYSTGYIFTRQKDKLSVVDKRFSLPVSLAYAASCTTPNGVFFAGGENENGVSDKAWLMHWDEKEQKVNFKALPSLPFPVTNASATVIGHIIYLAGGETPAAAVNQFIALDLDNQAQGWKSLASIPHAVSHTVLVGSPGKKNSNIYLCGGRKKNSNGISEFYVDVLMYDVASNKWQQKAPLPYALSAGTGSLYKEHCLLLFGGDKGIVFHETELLIAAISNEKDQAKKQELIRQKTNLQSTHPGFSNEVLRYNAIADCWQGIGTIPFPAPVTTTAVKWKKDFLIPSGEIKAGVRSPNILQVKVK